MKYQPIGKTACGYNVYGFEFDLDGDPYAIWIGWKGDEPKPYHMTRIADGTIAVEFNSCYGEHLYYEYWGDESLFERHPDDSADARRMTPEKAEKWLTELAESAWVTEEDTVWDNVTEKYYLDSPGGLPQHIFWSDSVGCLAGPGYGDGKLESAIDDVKEQLWPLFAIAGVPTMMALKDCLERKQPREIHGDSILLAQTLLHTPEKVFFGLYTAPVDSYCETDCRDGRKWLSSLSGESHPATAVAEADTIKTIDDWLMTTGVKV
jgi:hypothetical protein